MHQERERERPIERDRKRERDSRGKRLARRTEERSKRGFKTVQEVWGLEKRVSYRDGVSLSRDCGYIWNEILVRWALGLCRWPSGALL